MTSPSGAISVSIDPYFIAEGLNATKSGQKEGQTALLISAKSDQVIWLDFAKSVDSKRTIVKVLKKYNSIVAAIHNPNNFFPKKIYDGPYSTSPVLLSHDDYKKPSWVRSSGPNLYVEYYSYENETLGYYTTVTILLLTLLNIMSQI